MLYIPSDIEDLLTIINNTGNEKARMMGYKLLNHKLERLGFRWEYFVQAA